MAPGTVEIVIDGQGNGQVTFGYNADKKQNANLSARITVKLSDGSEQVTNEENLYKWIQRSDGIWHTHSNSVNCPAGSKANVLLYHANQNVAEQDFEF